MSEIKAVATFDNPVSPEFIQFKDELYAKKIEFNVEGIEGRTAANGGVYFAMAVNVKEEDMAAANECLLRIREELKKKEDIPSFCPKCDGNSIAKRAGFIWMSIIGKRKFICKDCGNEWYTK